MALVAPQTPSISNFPSARPPLMSGLSEDEAARRLRIGRVQRTDETSKTQPAADRDRSLQRTHVRAPARRQRHLLRAR